MILCGAVSLDSFIVEWSLIIIGDFNVCKGFGYGSQLKETMLKRRETILNGDPKGEVWFDILTGDVSILLFESEHRHEHKFETNP